jgi:prophage regulatory protein
MENHMLSKKTIAISELPSTGYVRLKKLITFLPFSRATLWRLVKSEKFPRQIKLSERVSAWRVEDIRAWMQARNDESLPRAMIQKRPITPKHLRIAKNGY